MRAKAGKARWSGKSKRVQTRKIKLSFVSLEFVLVQRAAVQDLCTLGKGGRKECLLSWD